jgi:Flp pilus assembly protein TadG
MIIVVCFILIVAIVIEHRRLSLLKQEVQRVSDDVKDLAAAEQRRFMQELKLATLKTDKQKSVA